MKVLKLDPTQGPSSEQGFSALVWHITKQIHSQHKPHKLQELSGPQEFGDKEAPILTELYLPDLTIQVKLQFFRQCHYNFQCFWH